MSSEMDISLNSNDNGAKRCTIPLLVFNCMWILDGSTSGVKIKKYSRAKREIKNLEACHL